MPPGLPHQRLERQQVEQYLLFEDMISATTYSRMMAKILTIPDEILTSYQNPGTTTESAAGSAPRCSSACASPR